MLKANTFSALDLIPWYSRLDDGRREWKGCAGLGERHPRSAKLWPFYINLQGPSFISLKRQESPVHEACATDVTTGRIAVVLKKISNMLRQLFRSQAPKEAEASFLAAQLEEKVLALVDNMPTLPDTATRAMALANDPDANFADLARLIEADTAIATGLLRVANSALYTGGAPAVKLHKAVVRLGMFQCKNLIVAIGMKSLFRKMTPKAREQCEALWHHGYVTGFLCGQINRSFRLGFDGEEFSAGLLHDLGRILLVLADADCAARSEVMDFSEDGDKLERERIAIGVDHAALGGWFGEHSKLPDTLIQTMRLHHELDLTADVHKLVALVASADHMANHLQRGEEITAYNPEGNTGLASLWARWPEGRRQRFLADIPAMMEQSVQAAAGANAA
jgi:HD-like signal output (HDOD) protein